MRITCVKVVATTVVALTAFCPALGAEIEGRIVSLAAPDGAGLVFCGLDDFPSSVPLGEQHAVTDERVNKNGVEMSLKRRVPAMDGRTLHGRLNALLDGKKKDRSEQSIALVALPGASAEAVLSSGSAWSVPVVNLSEGRTQTGSEKTLVPLSSVRPNDWRGRRVAFLGDSITDARHIGCTSNYWNFLERDLGIVPLVYGINGHQWKHVFGQAEKLSAAHSNKVDEIVIFAGTNDYNANVPLGGWSDGEKSFRGRIAAVMDYCERRFPGVTIWLMTPIHRGYATFGPGNVQPDETYANTLGLWISDYVDVIKEAAAKWRSARLIDLYAESGLYPLDASHEKFFHNARTDMLHPNTVGQERIARTMMRRLKFSNATELVRSCIDALPPEGGTLYFAKDTYHFYEDGSETMWLDPSNNQSGEKRVVFPLAGRRNVTIDGCGSTFVFHGRTFPFAATNGTGLTFRNFTVTTRYPSCAGFTVKEKDSGGFTVKFDEGVCPCKVENGHLTFTLDGCPVSTRDGRFSLHALDRLCISYLMAPESPGDKSSFPASFVGARAEDHGNREVRFSYYGDKHPKCCSIPYNAGERVAVNLEEKRYRDVFFFEDCRDVNVENVSIRRFGGMGVVAQRSGNIKVKGLKVVPPEGERVTLTADILQFINCYGQVSIVDCEGGHSLDDWINIHGNYLKILSVDGRRMRLKPQHPSQQGFFPYRPGDRIECLTAHTRAVTASARVLSVARDAQDASVAVITTDGEIAGRAHAGQLVENATLNPDVTISGNRFVNFPHLRLSGRGKYLVEGNRFQDCQKAVHGMDLADYWFESGRISDMTIRGNEIVNGGGFAFGLSGWNEGDPAAPKIHGRILIENNTFRSLKGEAVSAAGVRELIVKDPSAVKDFSPIGLLRPRTAPDRKDDQWMIGCEVLDRDFTRFSAYREWLPQLGIRTIRLQGGWAKCEKVKGTYDFAWLDECVDFALAHGLNPVLETDYGNPVYKGGGTPDLAGGFPVSEEALSAWDRWVDALSKHFKGRVRDWAMWNEPDFCKEGTRTPRQIVAFNVRTAKTILKNIPDARIAGLSLASNEPAFNEECYKAFGEDIRMFWRFIYHGYAPAPEESYPNVEKLKTLCAKYAPHATLWQGENGAPSEMPGDGMALNHIAWSEISQAKWDMRRMLGDYVRKIPSSVFCICDYYHPGFGIANYGLLRADSARNVIGVKRAFNAVRNVVSVFDSEITRVPKRVSSPESTLQLWEFKRRGLPLFVFWTAAEWVQGKDNGWEKKYQRPGDSLEKRPVVFRWPGEPLKEPVWVDLLSGEVLSFPKNRMKVCADGLLFLDVPVYDSPCVITERSAIGIIERSRNENY